MKLPDNVTESVMSRPSQRRYIGIDNRGQRWQITRTRDAWVAVALPGNPAFPGAEIEGSSLTAVAHSLAHRPAPVVREPF